MLKREIIVTSDGSTTIHLPDWNEQYHSKHGAIKEAYHVFINHGLKLFTKPNVSILEMGFGTGLNAFITFLESVKKPQKINYVGVDAYPIDKTEISQLNYVKELKAAEHKMVFEKMHQISWGMPAIISDRFMLTKKQQFFTDVNVVDAYDLIYFDAFGARVQPELWTQNIFNRMFLALKSKGVLVTYSAKGSVRRAMQSAGFWVEKLPGPPGKREMLRAIK